jgi:predicted enzyme related to lactoylglutathione lyase
MNKKRSLFQHVGLSVTDLDLAISFYKNVFGLKEFTAPSKSYCNKANKIKRRKDIFGSQMKEVKISNLLTDDGIGIELFEFKDPKAVLRKNFFEYWKSGIFHISFNVDNLDETIQKILENNGKIISKVWTLFPGCQMAYCQDPFANVFEILNCSFTEMVTEKLE